MTNGTYKTFEGIECFKGEHGMVDEMLQLVLSASLKALKVDALYGLHGKLSPETLASLLGNNIQVCPSLLFPHFEFIAMTEMKARNAFGVSFLEQ